jgi:hypothetical protein
LNALFSVIGSASTREETLQLQRTLTFMRENDGGTEMSLKSFDHCIEQVVRFHFPNDRNLNFTHWNAKRHSIDPLWVRASILEFVQSFKGAMKGMLLVSGLRESKKEKSYLDLRCFIEELVMKYAREDQNLSVLFF